MTIEYDCSLKIYQDLMHVHTYSFLNINLDQVNNIFLALNVRPASTVELFINSVRRSFIFKKGNKFVEVDKKMIGLENLIDPVERRGYNFTIPDKQNQSRYWKIYKQFLFNHGKCLEIISGVR